MATRSLATDTRRHQPADLPAIAGGRLNVPANNNIQAVWKLNEIELRHNIEGEASWHWQYRHSAYIYIGGLDPRLTEGDIIVVFSQWGEPVDIHLVRDKRTGVPKGFAFLAYEDQRSTILAVDNANGMQLLQRTLRVDHCKDYRPPDRQLKQGDTEGQENTDRNVGKYEATGAEGKGLGVYGVTRDQQQRFAAEKQAQQLLQQNRKQETERAAALHRQGVKDVDEMWCEEFEAMLKQMNEEAETEARKLLEEEAARKHRRKKLEKQAKIEWKKEWKQQRAAEKEKRHKSTVAESTGGTKKSRHKKKVKKKHKKHRDGTDDEDGEVSEDEAEGDTVKDNEGDKVVKERGETPGLLRGEDDYVEVGKEEMKKSRRHNGGYQNSDGAEEEKEGIMRAICNRARGGGQEPGKETSRCSGSTKEEDRRNYKGRYGCDEDDAAESVGGTEESTRRRSSSETEDEHEEQSKRERRQGVYEKDIRTTGQSVCKESEGGDSEKKERGRCTEGEKIQTEAEEKLRRQACCDEEDYRSRRYPSSPPLLQGAATPSASREMATESRKSEAGSGHERMQRKNRGEEDSGRQQPQEHGMRTKLEGAMEDKNVLQAKTVRTDTEGERHPRCAGRGRREEERENDRQHEQRKRWRREDEVGASRQSTSRE